MWKIEAILRPANVEDVADALKTARVHSFMMSDVASFDTKSGPQGSYRGAPYTMGLERVKLEVLVPDDYVEDAIKSILGAARAPLNGEDWLVVIPLDEVVRLASGRREPRQLGRYSKGGSPLATEVLAWRGRNGRLGVERCGFAAAFPYRSRCSSSNFR